jgi:hypothetical protein
MFAVGVAFVAAGERQLSNSGEVEYSNSMRLLKFHCRAPQRRLQRRSAVGGFAPELLLHAAPSHVRPFHTDLAGLYSYIREVVPLSHVIGPPYHCPFSKN